MRRAAWLLLLVLWCVAVVVAFSLIAGCSRDALPVPSDMSAARDAEPLGDCSLINGQRVCVDFGAPGCGLLGQSCCAVDVGGARAGCVLPAQCAFTDAVACADQGDRSRGVCIDQRAPVALCSFGGACCIVDAGAACLPGARCDDAKFCQSCQ